jgi:CRP-like cAMP-binding protein
MKPFPSFTPSQDAVYHLLATARSATFDEIVTATGLTRERVRLALRELREAGWIAGAPERKYILSPQEERHVRTNAIQVSR